MMAATPTGHMGVGMNLENIVDWSPAWTFTDAFQSSRGWITHAVDTVTGQMTWDVGQTNPVRVDANGNVAGLATFTNAAGRTMRQMAGTLMFRELNGGYPGGTYRAEWEGTGRVSFGMDARAAASGRTAAGMNYADLQVTPGNGGIYLRIEETSAADPVRNFRVWMPDWQGQSFAGQRWQPGAPFSPFHPLFRERLAPFGVIRFMMPQETNTSDIRTWADRRDARDIRQSSGINGSWSEPLANGMSVEHMVQLANDLDADPWFNMPHMADDTFVRNFAIYVRDNLEPGRKAYVEWSNEIWNFAWGFEATQWVAEQTRLPANAGLTHWQIAGREAKRDLDIWSDVFAGQTDRIVRVAAGQSGNDWVTARIADAMQGSFDAIAIAPYFSPSGPQRAAYTAATSVDQVLADTRAAIDGSVGQVNAHQRLADTWTTRLGRDVKLLAYEGGHHLDGRNAPYQNVFYAAGRDPRMGDLYRDYLRRLDAAGMDLYVDFTFTGRGGASQWGDFAKLHRMDEPLATAHLYNAVVAAANGSLWDGVVPPPSPPPPPPTLSIASASTSEGNSGLRDLAFTITLSAAQMLPVSVNWSTANGTAIGGSDYSPRSGQVVFAPGQTSRTVVVPVIGDTAVEADETFKVQLARPQNATLAAAFATGTITNDDVAAPAITLTRDIPYATVGSRTLLLDAYRPAGAGPFPAVVLAHGGGFTGGSKGGYTGDLARSLAAAGYAVFDINYRLLGDLGRGATLDRAMNAAREDLGRAVDHVVSQAAAYGVDASRVAVGGGSAGAITALLAAYGPDRVRVRPRAVINLWGGMYGRERSLRAGDPPVLVVHGTADRTVPYSQAEALVAAARRVGVRTELVRVENGGHTLGLDQVVAGRTIRQSVREFLDRTMR
jgi:acetyl esterase/lipase